MPSEVWIGVDSIQWAVMAIKGLRLVLDHMSIVNERSSPEHSER